MMDPDFPGLQDLDSLHLEDYQLMQEKISEKSENFTRSDIYHHPIHDKPDLLIQDSNQISIDPFKIDLLTGCTNELSFIPHLETLESVLGSLQDEDVKIQESQQFTQILDDDDFFHHAFASNFTPNETSMQVLNETKEFSGSDSTSPPVSVKNQKRLNNFDPDDVFQIHHEDTGKKKKWSGEEGSSNTNMDFKVVSILKVPTDKPKRALKKSSDGETGQVGEKLPRHKRPSHINAEQRRRSKIQNCLDQLHEIVPAIAPDVSAHQNVSNKKSKASILYKTANCCRLLKSKTRDLESETDVLRAEIKTLCKQIKEYQSKLPENGATQALQKSSPSAVCSSKTAMNISMNQRFEDYVHISTLRNWKFWIFSLFIRPLYTSYLNSTGLSANANDFKRRALLWLREECKLSKLRGTLTSALLTASSRTSMVSNASNLPVESIRESMRDAGIDLFTTSARPDSR